MEIKRFTLGDIRSNCYIIHINQKALIIDPGFDSELVKSYLVEQNLTPVIIYATHGHFDHIGGINGLKTLYPDLVVYAPLKDQVFFSHTSGVSRLPYTVKVDHYLSDLEPHVIEFEGIRFYIIHTPGHSLGSTCLYTDGHLFSGDTLFKETIGRTDLYLSSFESIKDSILRKLYILKDDTICYPGHGLTTTIGHEKKYNAFFRVNE